MKRAEIVERLWKGAMVLTGQYRGGKVELKIWMDKETGRKKESQVVHHNLELADGSDVVRIMEYFAVGEEITPVAKKGDWVAVFGFTLERVKGSILCRVDRKSIHVIED